VKYRYISTALGTSYYLSLKMKYFVFFCLMVGVFGQAPGFPDWPGPQTTTTNANGDEIWVAQVRRNVLGTTTYTGK
jgi:hypothetical protein